MNFRCVKGFLGIGALFVSLFFCSGMVSASEVDTVTLEVPVSCTLTKTVNTVHEVAMRVGQYENDIGETAFNVICNDPEGFSIYAVGYSGDEYGNTTMVPTNNGITNAIATGTATSGDVSNWAMKLASVSGDYAPTLETGFNDYHVIPNAYTKVAEFPSNTDASSGSSFKSTYATYISTSQAADTYVGKVKFTVVHPSSELAPIENIAQLTYMQDFKDLTAEQRTSVLNSMSYNTTYNLIDSRDGKTYQIARLKDDDIWMVDNLDLGRTELTTNLTSENTNLSETVTAETFNGWKKESGSVTYTAGEFIPLTTSNTSDGLDTDPTSGTAYGTLYNYYATSAGTISGNSNSTYASHDICPAGWRLPTGGDSGEFQNLYSYYSSSANLRNPVANNGAAFNLPGATYTGSPKSQGQKSIFWSSAVASSENMYDLLLKTDSVDITDNSSRGNCYNIRCISKKPSHTLTISYSTGVSNVKVNGITIQNGGVVNLEEGVSYSVVITPAEGYTLSDLNSTSGTIGSNTSEVTTYAIGSDNATLTANTMLTIQNIDPSNCTSTASQVLDNRDNHIYTIQRLADGRCWMMDNLDLGRTALTKDLTSANTNIATTITASTFNSWKKTSGDTSYTTGEFIPVNFSTTNNIDSVSNTPFGTLYNYYAASAGTISTETNSSNAMYDICPARWRLPTGNTTGEYQTLYTHYNTYDNMRAPIANGGVALALAGGFDNGAPYTPLNNGFYWSSTRYNDVNMYYTYLSSNTIYFNTSVNRYTGKSIRCILEETSISDLTYMQDFSSLSYTAKTSVYDSMANNTVYNLIDNRDNKSYQIARLKDGQIWMAENLDLGHTTLNTDLTSANTNLTTTITAETFNGWKRETGTSTYGAAIFVSVSGTDSVSGTPFGTLYNYCATSAGTVCSGDNNSSTTNNICPAGWRLPTDASSSGEFQTLYTQYGSIASMRAPIADGGAAFALAGIFTSGTPSGQNSSSHYWTSTRSGNTNARALSLSTSSITTSVSCSRDHGFSIRCVVK